MDIPVALRRITIRRGAPRRATIRREIPVIAVLGLAAIATVAWSGFLIYTAVALVKRVI